ncbi:hypothetical protein E8E12_002992 [Didymella heteroderae]|uniref:Uncharacterized protein n=1 Tax=Didymella heteroderae TaxID=1769908 RepID=A0A9P4WX56_9PLEO|nr:hypothetical protein E8E12_002992 [Didymella heteroderae]
MEPAIYTSVEKGEAKAQEPRDEPETPKSKQSSSAIRTGSLPSPPTSPVQGARLPMSRRFPVHPTLSSPPSSPAKESEITKPSARTDQTLSLLSQRFLTGLNLEAVSNQHVVGHTASGDSIAESMTKAFKYDPEDKTPSKRRMKAHTEPSSNGRGDDVAGSPSGFRIEQPNCSALNVVEPGIWMGQNNLRKGTHSTFSEPPSPLEDGLGEAGSSRAAEFFFSSDASMTQPPPGDISPVESNGFSLPDAADLEQYPSAISTSPEPLPYPLPAPPPTAATSAWSSRIVHLSPIQEVDSSRDLEAGSPDASPPAPMQTESEKPPPVTPSAASFSSVSSSAAGCVSKCYSITWYILAWAVPFAFLSAALYSLATTRTFKEMPPGVFTAESKTFRSENGNGNLTVAWMKGHAVELNMSLILNTTLDAGATGSKNLSFLFEWRADGEIISVDVATTSGKAHLQFDALQ